MEEFLDNSFEIYCACNLIYNRFISFNISEVGKKLYLFDNYKAIGNYFIGDRLVLPFFKENDEALNKRIIVIKNIFQSVCLDFYNKKALEESLFCKLLNVFPNLNKFFLRKGKPIDKNTSTFSYFPDKCILFRIDLSTDKDQTAINKFNFSKSDDFRICFSSHLLCCDWLKVLNYFECPHDYQADFERGMVILGKDNLKKSFVNLLTEIIQISNKYPNNFNPIKFLLYRVLHHIVLFYEDTADSSDDKFRIVFCSTANDLQRYSNSVIKTKNGDYVLAEYSFFISNNISLSKHASAEAKQYFEKILKSKKLL